MVALSRNGLQDVPTVSFVMLHCTVKMAFSALNTVIFRSDHREPAGCTHGRLAAGFQL